MNKSAASLVLAGTLSLATLAGCGSSSSSSSPSTSVTSTVSSSTTTPSASTADTGSASADASASTSASPSDAGSAATGDVQGRNRTLHNWSVTVPQGWTESSSSDSDGTYITWKTTKAASGNLRLIDGQMGKTETFADDTKSLIDGFGGKVDSDKPVTVKGASEAREAQGYSTVKNSGSSATARQYIDMVMAHKDREIVIYAAIAPTKADLDASGLRKYLGTLAHS